MTLTCNMATVYIETERLILRSWKDTDKAPFAEMNSNPEVMKYFPTPLSAEESNAFIDRINAEFDATGFGLYAVEIKDTEEFIGYVGFHRFAFDAPFSPNWEIGWRLSHRYWHKGYATEAASACIAYARAKRLCPRLYSFTALPNTPSENVMQRIGMTFEGTFPHPALPDTHPLQLHKLYSLPL